MKIIIILTLAILCSCATQKQKPQYYNDLVSVGVAIDLARSAYLRGCSDLFVSLGKSNGSFNFCLNRANAFVDQGIEALFESEKK